ncbi:MAG: GTPase ObgE [Candidatus Pacebacteria bacterium]|nr:GTPase ObgE [Candidatus Paceibacterota bacterium]
MALIDTLTIRAVAGKGGDGVVRWLHTRGKEKGGPSGGDGGRGGDVLFRTVRDLGVLARYKGRKDFGAEHGEPGGNDSMHGANGASIIIDVPVGSFITNLTTGETFDLMEDDQEVVALKGGNGGFGNEHFKSSTNQNPYDFRPGAQGQSAEFRIELKIIADAGFVGLPNAGKSSLLNALTAARAKIGDYPFTTLEPNLGVLFGYVLADIPGLIEGAAEGKGLGHEFLRHIARTKMLVHCIAADTPDPLLAYNTVRTELEAHGDGLGTKPELVCITKIDTVPDTRVTEIRSIFSALNRDVMAVTVLDDESIKKASDTLVQTLKKTV